MEQPQFEALVQRMEQFAQRSPRAYRWRIYALAAFGFISLLLLIFSLLTLLVLAALLARHAAGVAVKLIVVIGALLLVVVRALRARMRPPEREELIRDEAPALKQIEGLRSAYLVRKRVTPRPTGRPMYWVPAPSPGWREAPSWNGCAPG
jgi:hypothetical protein